ncbi:hypothetical protein CAEBREN_13288 [Caenorhabditis brenneri]|uniref:KANSL3 helical domain-containing protein n=1 Tax=Caenorhabditis brenneri TaxID=135651 RepID=G0MTV3_CAEBE|nr:hypothetical protein CAEBREN_13288 [Caenorhabditis brenneri]
MSVFPDHGAELHNRNESRQIMDLIVFILSMNHSCHVEQFCTLIKFGPETMFQDFLGFIDTRDPIKHIKMIQDTHNAWTPAKKPATAEPIQDEEPVIIASDDQVNEGASTSESAPRESRGRSPTLEKRSRNKAKKRFSPSPVTKKRRTMLVSTPSSSTPSGSTNKGTESTNKTEFAEGLRSLGVLLDETGPVDYDIPDEWKSPTPSETVEKIIHELSGKSNKKTKATSASATSTHTPVTTNSRKSQPAKKARASNLHSRMQDAELVVTPVKVNSPDQSTSNGRCRTVSSELGVNDDQESMPDTNAVKNVPLKTPKKRTDMKTPNKRASRKSEATTPKVDNEETMDQGEAPEAVDEEETTTKTERASKRKSAVKSRARSDNKTPSRKLTSEDEPSTSSQATSSEAVIDQEEEESTPVNPNSALAIKQRLLGSANKTPRSRSVRRRLKAEEDPAPIAEQEPQETSNEIPPVVVQDTPSVIPTPPVQEQAPKTPAKKTPQAAVVPPARVSARVSKPNRLYNDQSFNTEILGRTRVTEQNPVKEAQAKEATPDPVDIPLPTSARKKPTTPKAPSVPKPIPVVNGVQVGYTPSVKIPIEDHESEGVVVKLNDDVSGTLDTILLKVCKDGVKKHEDIDPRVVKSKQKAKMDHAKRMKLQAKKLDIQMNVQTPSSSEDLGKRKRQAPKSIDDIYWTPPVNRSKGRAEVKEDSEREVTPFEDQGPHPIDERRQQRARESISHLFDAEMDATIKEAKKYSVSFDKYIRPKLVEAQKHANIKLMSRRRQSADPEDFYYHELLVDQVSPSNSNVENVEELEVEEVDVLGMEDSDAEEEVTQKAAISIRAEALDVAEQVAVFIPRPASHDGTPLTMEQIQTKALEHLETRKQCLSSTLNIVLNQYSHETAPVTRGVDEQGCNWHTATSANAQNLKNVYTISDGFKEDSITWTHQFLIENLPVNIMASYLSVLKYAKRLNPSRFAYVISTTEQLDSEWSKVTSLLKTFVAKRASEPGVEILGNTIPYRRMDNTVFLLVSPTLTSGEHQRQRQHGRIFRWLQSIGHLDSEIINVNDQVDSSCSVAEFLADSVVDRICDKVRQKSRDNSGYNIVLVGFGATTYLVHRAANIVGGISAIISIGFPVMTPFGRRGTADDEILLTYCPTLFIVGSEGQRFDNKAMTELRSSMISNSGLVVVGHASDLLLVPTSLLLRLGISQTIVYRMILEKILDFLNLEAFHNQVSSELVPIELNNVYDLDSSILKSDKALSGLAFSGPASASSSAAPSPVGASGRRATVSGAGEEAPKRKRDQSSVSRPPTYSTHPPTPSPNSEHFESYMQLTVSTSDDMPRRASMGSSPRVVERGDFRDHRLNTPRSSIYPSQPSTSMQRPLDPASISLI